MAKGAERSLTEEVLYNLFKILLKVVIYISRKLWRFLLRYVFGIKDKRIYYGRIGSRFIFDKPKNRNRHTTIKGKTGVGKSALAVNLAIQNIHQGTRVLFIDPHGNPEKEENKGAIVEIFERVKDTSNLVFLTVNQKTKVVGYNPLFLIAERQKLNNLRDELMNSIFYDSLYSGHQVSKKANVFLSSAIYFHNAYFDWLLHKTQDPVRTKAILQSRQITINDLVNLDNRLIDLFIEILGFKLSKYYRPDLVTKWLEMKEKGNLGNGSEGVLGRLENIVRTYKCELFFESHGFDLIKYLQKNKSVLCDISNLDNFTISVITKLILTKVWSLHNNRILTGQTEMYIDEASNAEIPNLPYIIAEGRTYNLALTLIFHYIKQFRNLDLINSITNTVVTKINFRNNESDFNAPLEKIANLKDREFILENSKGVFERIRTLDMPPSIREIEFTEFGVEEKHLDERMMAKRTDIFKFFLKI